MKLSAVPGHIGNRLWGVPIYGSHNAVHEEPEEELDIWLIVWLFIVYCLLFIYLSQRWWMVEYARCSHS
jgi:hypothetical protein